MTKLKLIPTKAHLRNDEKRLGVRLVAAGSHMTRNRKKSELVEDLKMTGPVEFVEGSFDTVNLKKMQRGFSSR